MGIKPMNEKGSRTRQASPMGDSMTKAKMSAAIAVQIRQCR
jgi:hypothetical protein